MVDKPGAEHAGKIVIRRRTLLMSLLAAGVLTPLIGTSTALAEQGLLAIPENSGCRPWW